VSRVERFEDLIAWQKARTLTRDVDRATKQGEFARDYGLARQLQRASVSIMSNVAEGFERGGRGEFHQIFSTAKASCAETRSLLYVALNAEYIDDPTFTRLLSNADEVARIIGGLRAKVEHQRDEQRTSGRNA
jgi:four helix bundle protein